MPVGRISRRVLQNVVRTSIAAPRRTLATQVPQFKPDVAPSQPVPNVSSSDDQPSGDRDAIPVEMMTWKQRLTRTSDDRTLLQKTLFRVGQLMVVTLMVNGAYMYMAREQLKPASRDIASPGSKAEVELEKEDQELVDRVLAAALPELTERMAVAPRHIPQPLANAPSGGVRSAGEPFASSKHHS